jgi:hypothetical protein
MAHLSDMEELLSSIQTQTTRDYMREAMNCYMTTAYRGCIVLSYIALFDDLLSKLEQLSKVNADAKAVFLNASKKKADQDVFETLLIDQLAAKTLIDQLDAQFLETLRTLRNKSAHPSGHKPSAEEARFVYHECITRFLARPVLSTTQLVDQLIARLANSNFFPTVQLEDLRDISKEEIALVHEEAIPQLIDKLVQVFKGSDSVAIKNATLFLVGLAQCKSANIDAQIKKRLIQEKSDDMVYAAIVLSIVTLNGGLVEGLPSTVLLRLQKLVIKQLDDLPVGVTEISISHPARVLASIVSVLSDAEIAANFEPALTAIYEKRPYSRSLISALSPGSKSAQLLYEALLKKAGSGQFDTANAFASAAVDLDEALAPLFTNEMCFSLLVAVIRAAEIGAYGAQSLSSSTFGSLPALRGKAKTFAETHEPEAEAIVSAKLHQNIKAKAFISQYFDEPKVSSDNGAP